MSLDTYMYERSDETTNFHVVHIAQTKGSVEYISNTYGSVTQSEKNDYKPILQPNNDTKYIFSRVLCVRIFKR